MRKPITASTSLLSLLRQYHSIHFESGHVIRSSTTGHPRVIRAQKKGVHGYRIERRSFEFSLSGLNQALDWVQERKQDNENR